MQALIETLFDAVYLVSVITIGILMIRGSKGNKQFCLFGLMAVVLGAGDSFHLIPRALALCTTGLENYTVPLGLGKWITSVTMTIFYVLLYYVWRQRYQIKGKGILTAAVYALAAARVVLCMMPQNQWLSANAPLSWGIYRNIPFALMGLLIIVLFYRSAKENNDASFRWMWLTIVLSFGFYIPVVLWVDAIPMIGMLMIPKTCAYIWTVLIGFFAMKKECKYHKRLKGYASLGYSVLTEQDAAPGSDVIYDQVTFQNRFLQDIAQARQSVLIFSPLATPRRVQWLAAALEQCAQKRISVTVVMRSAESLPERSRKSAQIAVERLKSQNCSLIFQSDIHQKYAIIDDRIVWYGSINLLSFGSSQESMMRLISGSIAHELMKTEAFNENH